MSGSRIDDGCDALFLIAILRNCGDGVVVKILVCLFSFFNYVY